MIDPRQFNVGHDEFRKGQGESIQYLLSDERKKHIVYEALTGTGKSAVAMSLGSHGKTVRVLTKTLSLQEQYLDYPETKALFGMSNYECAMMPSLTAKSCFYMHEMFACPKVKQCEYVLERSATQESDRQILSYAYFLASSWTKKEGTDYLFMDEAHEFPELLMDSATLVVDHRMIKTYDMEPWPTFGPNIQALLKQHVLPWLVFQHVDLRGRIEDIRLKMKDWMKVNETAKGNPYTWKLNDMKILEQRMELLLEAWLQDSDSIYVERDDKSLTIAPLSARRLFLPDMVAHFPRVIFSSATIGNVDSYMSSIGRDDYDFMTVPSNYSPEQMPIYVSRDAPYMRYGMSENEKKKWADVIYEIISNCPRTWPALIHTSSIKQANELAVALSRKGFQDRVYLSDVRSGTNKKVQDWENALKRTPNLINIAWYAHEGVDAGNMARINIVAKIPYAPLSGLGRAKFEYDQNYYQWRAAILTMQACGRNRRGFDEHYDIDPDNPSNRIVAIVDSAVWRLRDQFSDHFNRCLKEY